MRTVNRGNQLLVQKGKMVGVAGAMVVVVGRQMEYSGVS